MLIWGRSVKMSSQIISSDTEDREPKNDAIDTDGKEDTGLDGLSR